MKVTEIADCNGIMGLKNDKSGNILLLGSMCNNSDIQYIDGRYIVNGDPTESAIVESYLSFENMEFDTQDTCQSSIELNLPINTPRVSEIPFDSERKLMTTIHKIGDRYKIITKGAPDVLLSKCAKVLKNGRIEILTEEMKEKVLTSNSKLANKALRVLGVSYLEINEVPEKMDANVIEKDLIFVGLIGMIDPPREGVKDAVALCKRAGIKTVMITGDHILTAKAIAKELGILANRDLSITGEMLDKISSEEFEKNIHNYSVFARVSPQHKVRIVKAFKDRGDIVAMTGDGVNDAPALKISHIGCAMGLSGTDVAKGAADIILTDDNFNTIVGAVREGRTIYENIKKAVHFLLSSNVGEIVTIFFAILFGWQSPLLAIHLLWVNLVTDSLPAIALGLEPVSKNIMLEKPRNTKKSMFADGLGLTILIQGFMIGMLSLLAFSIGSSIGTVETGRTMAFAVLSLSELIHAFNIKSKESIINKETWNNKYLFVALGLGVLLQIIVISIPLFNSIFRVEQLTLNEWVYVGLLSFAPVILVELQKWFNGLIYGKRIYNVEMQRYEKTY